MKIIPSERVPVEYTPYLHLTAALARTLGRWWCDQPPDQQEDLAKLCTELKPEIGLCGMTEHNKEMLSHFKDKDMAKRALALPDTVFAEYSNRNHRRQDLLRLQTATMVEVQFATALRPKNLASLIIGKHLLERAGKLHISVPKAEVKTKIDLEFVLPDRTSALLRAYMKHVRPGLLREDSAALWPGKSSKPKKAARVGMQIGDFVEREIGVRVTGHRFRHLCGFLFLQGNPDGYEVVRLLLGHKSIKTTVLYYCGAEAEEALKRYDAFISRRRRELGIDDDTEDDGDRD